MVILTYFTEMNATLWTIYLFELRCLGSSIIEGFAVYSISQSVV